jgi:hypothetical protein
MKDAVSRRAMSHNQKSGVRDTVHEARLAGNGESLWLCRCNADASGFSAPQLVTGCIDSGVSSLRCDLLRSKNSLVQNCGLFTTTGPSLCFCILFIPLLTFLREGIEAFLIA